MEATTLGSLAGVAGVYAPAFVERIKTDDPEKIRGRVAGVYAPAFVERGEWTDVVYVASWCRRGLCPGLR